ncbi:uncharacterized protein V1518DRAFT_422796 [Limtongia smithiae]|uniref:uncharacterized protein n=1 Tax=Limtongia smithiae TaxID=1125753 RepID=UPI0034CED39E
MGLLFGGASAASADPVVADLFATSSGPVQRPDRRVKRLRAFEAAVKRQNDVEDDDEEAERSEESEERVSAEKASKKRKRAAMTAVKAKPLDEDDVDEAESTALEDAYLRRLIEQDAEQDAPARPADVVVSSSDEDDEDDEALSSHTSITTLAATASPSATLTSSPEILQSKRTIFVGNLPSSAISDKSHYSQLRAHFAPYGAIASIRFRSVAFAEMLPRKIAFLQHKLHEHRSTVNAYIVFRDSDAKPGAAAATAAARALNGSVLLSRHIRVDAVAHPAKQDHKRCVFVGNLDFEAEEEALWTAFAAAGEVEYVRVVRDAKTNMGKGFAYVQFKDALAVQRALVKLKDVKVGKRVLRVARAKNIPSTTNLAAVPGSTQKKPRAIAAIAGGTLNRARRSLGKADRAQLTAIVAEGERATQGSTSASSLKLRRTKNPKSSTKKKPRIRARSTAFKKAGNKKPAKSSS